MTEQDFIAAIVAEPHSDAHRLVYADWLEETGQPERADFVRRQIQSARMACMVRIGGGDESLPLADCGIPDCRYCEGRRHEASYLHQHGKAWLANWPLLVGSEPGRDVLGVEWRRGFPSTLRCEIGWWLANHKRALASVPLERLELCGPVAVRCERTESDSSMLVTYITRLDAMNGRGAKWAWRDISERMALLAYSLPWMDGFDQRNEGHIGMLLSRLWPRLKVEYEAVPHDLELRETDCFPPTLAGVLFLRPRMQTTPARVDPRMFITSPTM